MSRYVLRTIDERKLREVESRTLRRLLAHLRDRADVQNIDLMLLAGFCRNCLSKWFMEEARGAGLALELESAREYIYGMPYSEYKDKHQYPVSEEKLIRLKQRKIEQGPDS